MKKRRKETVGTEEVKEGQRDEKSEIETKRKEGEREREDVSAAVQK